MSRDHSALSAPRAATERAIQNLHFRARPALRGSTRIREARRRAFHACLENMKTRIADPSALIAKWVATEKIMAIRESASHALLDICQKKAAAAASHVKSGKLVRLPDIAKHAPRVST